MIELRFSLNLSFFARGLIILSIQWLSDSNKMNDMVGFNDAIARVDKIGFVQGQIAIYYGDIPNHPLIDSQLIRDKREALKYKAIFLDPLNGKKFAYTSEWSIFQPPDGPGDIEVISNQSYDFGPMKDDGYWRFKGRTLADPGGRFDFLAIFKAGKYRQMVGNFSLLMKSNRELLFVQEFKWNGDLFACFTRTGGKLIVLQLKKAPENWRNFGTYISSFIIESTPQPAVFFLPSHEEPIMYYSREEGGMLSFYDLKLKVATQTTEGGFQKCLEEGQFPKGFFKLRTYMENSTKEYFVNNTGECSRQVPTFIMGGTALCFKIPSNVLYSSIDTYTVSLSFNAKILSYVADGFDVRCNLSDCNTTMASCKREEIELEEGTEFASIFWDFDKFALSRWTVEGERKLYRLLDCEYFYSCPLCVLYGAFNCVWKYRQCVKRRDGESETDSCYSNVPAMRKILGHERVELVIELAYELNRKNGEKVTVTFWKEYLDVQYDGSVYKVIVGNFNNSNGVITIKRGSHNMSNTFVIIDRPPFSIGSIAFAIILSLIVIGIVSIIAFFYAIGKKRGAREFVTTSMGVNSTETTSVPSG